jgi:hypothetical protein
LWNEELLVSREALMSKAKEYTRNNNKPFKASHGWMDGWMV